MDVLDLVRDYFIDQEDTMKKLITFFMNLVMESEAEQQAGATRYERSEKRAAHRNGKRRRCLKTKYGDLVLDKPNFREKPFETVVFDRYSRVERSIENAIVESYIQGVSTRRIRSIIETLGVKGYQPTQSQEWRKIWIKRLLRFSIVQLNIPFLILS